MFKRRIGPDPHAPLASGGTTLTANSLGCPDIWELEDGQFAIIGATATERLKAFLPPGASCGDDEAIVIVPRGTLVNARGDIPKE